MKLRASIPVAMVGLVSGLLLGSVSIMPNAQASDRHVARSCSNASLNGSYGFYRTGVSAAGPLAAVGIGIFDGHGNMTGSQSISKSGAFAFDVDILGTVQVAQDCTGKGYTPGGVGHFRIVVVDGGNGFYLFSESPGGAVFGVGRKIHPEPLDD